MNLPACRQFEYPDICPELRKSRDCAEAYAMYAAQEIPQIDTEIAQKGHFLSAREEIG